MLDDLTARLDDLAARAATRVEAEAPVYRELPPGVLVAALHANLERGMQVLREPTAPSAEELEQFTTAAVDRALQGFPLQEVLRAYRLGLSEVWGAIPPLAAAHGLGAAQVLELAGTIMTWGDAVTDAVAGAHARVGLQLAREDQQRRDTFVHAVISGTLQGEDLRRAGVGFGLDLEHEYVPARIRPDAGCWSHGLTHRVELALGGRPGVVGQVDGDTVAIARAGPEAIVDTTIAVGPRTSLATIPASFAAATRALQTARAFGVGGVVALDDLSIRPAVLADEDLGRRFEERHLVPLDRLGRHGAELESTLRTWLQGGMRHDDTARALHVHPNTLRHRLRRFEELTGASLRDIRTIVELWWALERRSIRDAPQS